jgi:hypothetical protein
MRGGALRCRFVHFEFTGTCPPPALRSLEPCSHQGVHRNLINVSKEQNYSWLGNLQHSGECTLCEVSSHLVKILHSGCKPGTDHTVAGLGFLLSARVLAGTSGSTLCLRFGVRRRGDERKRTAISLPLRRTTSQSASNPSSSIMSSNVSGAFTLPVMRSRAP